MGFQKIINSLDTTSDNKDLLKKGSKFMINKKKKYSINEEIRMETRNLIVLSIKHISIV